MSVQGHKRTQPARAVLSSVAQSLLPQLASATFGATGSGVAASCSVVCSSVALATGLIIAMGIASYTLRLAARNTPSGSPRFLALPVLTLPCNNCDGDRQLYVEAGGKKHTQRLAP